MSTTTGTSAEGTRRARRAAVPRRARDLRPLRVYVGRKLGLYTALADAAQLASELAAGRTSATPASGSSSRRSRDPQGRGRGCRGRARGTAFRTGRQALVTSSRSSRRRAAVVASPPGGLVDAFRRRRRRGLRRRRPRGAGRHQCRGSNPRRESRVRTSRALSADPPARVADVACGAAGRPSRSPARTRRRRSTASTSTLDRARPRRTRRRGRARRPDRVPRARRGRPRVGRPLRPRDDVRGAARHVAPGRGPARDARAGRPRGAVLVVDERVADSFTAPGDDVERMMYGWSILLCLPTGLARRSPPPRRPATVCERTRCAATPEAGVLAGGGPLVEHDFFRSRLEVVVRWYVVVGGVKRGSCRYDRTVIHRSRAWPLGQGRGVGLGDAAPNGGAAARGGFPQLARPESPGAGVRPRDLAARARASRCGRRDARSNRRFVRVEVVGDHPLGANRSST